MKRLNEISLESKIDIEYLALKYTLKKDYINKVIFGVHNNRPVNEQGDMQLEH